MSTFSTAPTSFYLSSIQALLNWTSSTQAFDAFNIVQVPLQNRNYTGAPRPLLMDCSDYKGGYVCSGDLWPQGILNANTYNFSYWQYLDSFCYFAHYRISVPTTWWTNAAHLNGVPSIGTVIFGGGDSGEVTTMLNNSTSCIRQLTAMMQHYNFDGWFFNVETGLDGGAAQAAELSAFLIALRASLLNANPNAMVGWYDAVDSTGGRNYQNCLDADNNTFFLSSHNMFTNYGWTQDNTQTNSVGQSVAYAKGENRSPFDVYMGVDVWGNSRDDIPLNAWVYDEGYGVPNGDSVSASTFIAQNGASVGLFAPGWTFEKATSHADFETRDTLFWVGSGQGHNAGNSTDCIAQGIAERTMPMSLPFATNFDTGCGSQFVVRGQTWPTSANNGWVMRPPQSTCDKDCPLETGWSNLSLQGLLPTYRFWAVGGTASAFTAALSQAAAYDGGSCVQITGTASATATSTVTYRLFDFNAPVSTSSLQVNAAFQPQTAGAAFPSIQLQLHFSDGSSMTTNARATQISSWYLLSQTLGGVSGKTLTGLWLIVGPSFNGGAPSGTYGVNLGMISIWSAATPPAPTPVSNLQAQPIYSDGNTMGAWLTWTSAAGASRYFDLWQQNGGNWKWLTRVCANTAWIPDIAPIGGSGSFTFAVQPISYGLIGQDPSQMAQVTLTLSPNSFNDGATIALVGNPSISQLVIQSGNVFDGFQATNGSYGLPAHGGGPSSPPAQTINVPANDPITTITGFTGNWHGWNCVVQVTIKTQSGKSLGTFGTMSGAINTQAFTLNQPGQSIVALNGTTMQVPLGGGNSTTVINSLSASYQSL